MATLKQLRVGLGWTIARMVKETGLARQTIGEAEKKGAVRADSAKAIADALSRGYGKEIQPWDIEGLTVL